LSPFSALQHSIEAIYIVNLNSAPTIKRFQSSLAQLVARSAVTRFRRISDTVLHSIPEG
jgi:uncharacterized FlgJ-related protein